MNNDTMSMTEMYKTTDYNKFKTHRAQPSNRTGAYGELVVSLKMTGGNHFDPIKVTKNLEVLDGHRRLASSKIAGLPVYYTILDEMDERAFIIAVNTTARNWTTLGYINSNSHYDPEYGKLEEFLTKEGASTELLRLFVQGVSLSMLKVGGDISHFDYEYLDNVRRTVLLVGGAFDIRHTAITRMLAKARKKIGKNFDIVKLHSSIERDLEKGAFAAQSFKVDITNKMVNIMVKSYKHK